MTSDNKPSVDINTLDKFDMTVPVRCHSNSQLGMKMAFFKFADCIVDVHDGNEDIGSFGGVMGGYYEFNIDSPSDTGESFGFVIHPIDMWNSLLTALEVDGRFPDSVEQMKKIGYQDFHITKHQKGKQG